MADGSKSELVVVTSSSQIGRGFSFVLLAMCILGGIGGLAAFAVWLWRVIPNHALALAAVFVLIPMLLWALTQDD
jgi:hypothetical protein